MNPLPVRALLSVVLSLLASRGYAEAIAVLGKQTIVSETLLEYTKPPQPRASEFLQRFSALLKLERQDMVQAALGDFPVYGRDVAGAKGLLDYKTHFFGGLPVHVKLSGLTPKHVYLLTLNGNPERPGNEHLVDPVPGNEKERFYDFQRVITDENGAYEATFGIFLPPGNYETRFYVKDTTDFKIILYHDFFGYVVE